MEEQFIVTITQEMMDSFAQLSGDYNPLHRSQRYATEKGFEDKIVYGMLVASFYSTLAGMYMPGKNCLLQKVHSDFLKPVYIGDELIIKGIVKQKTESIHNIIIKASIYKKTRETIQLVSRSEIWAGYLDGE